jgi:hypothetical protein
MFCLHQNLKFVETQSFLTALASVMDALGLLWLALLLLTGGQARVVQEVPSEEYYMNYKQVQDCDNPMVDGTCPLLGGPYRLPNL